ncbi:hypothetical protein BD413DRAFT_181425 [Trametes elegans]|nr:hypothetical protein BD413DRAFT_181425 [Trametes elegans]
MSDDADTAYLIQIYESFVQGEYFSISARALFLWDYFVTLDREVEYIWKKRLSAASILFILNRYVNLGVSILEVIEQAPFQTSQAPARG